MMFERPTGQGIEGQQLSSQLIVFYVGVQSVEQGRGAALSFV